ncbi:hypothetical protein E4U56_007291 [Claviceps arundinis]|uniref:Uncharacterized protein n=1 Tax=Claviceps arundinis TaxID=1623583 RepID=A0A9P7SQ70_9HYPO|nr:hypothetical protein E4U56_007291 [Claviceps arundinis]
MSGSSVVNCNYCGQLNSSTIPQSQCLGCAANAQARTLQRQSSSARDIETTVNGKPDLGPVGQQGHSVVTSVPIPRATGRKSRSENFMWL